MTRITYYIEDKIFGVETFNCYIDNWITLSVIISKFIDYFPEITSYDTEYV
jgi:hypothetical protein